MEVLRDRIGSLMRDDRGTVTAEFALTVPAVLLVLGLVLGSIQLTAERVALVSLAGELARLEARGDSETGAARLARFAPTPAISRDDDGRVLCVTASSTGRGALSMIKISGTGCAALIAAE